MRLDAYDLWMVKCALERISNGASPKEVVDGLKGNGYNSVANEVERLSAKKST